MRYARRPALRRPRRLRSCAWRRTRCSRAASSCRPEGGPGGRSIQAPHYQTDRDVGAASIGEGLLAAYAVTHDARYLFAAKAAGDFLLGVAEPESGGLRWPDWADPDGQRSATHYTSYDDGAAGISDYLLQLSNVTRRAALPHGRARRACAGSSRRRRASCPQIECSWNWTDDPSDSVAYYGVGMGQAGIVLALDTFADAHRATPPSASTHARAPPGCERSPGTDASHCRRGSRAPDVFETGFLNGSAGAAFVFLERYAHDHDPRRSRDGEAAARLGERPGEADGRGGAPLAARTQRRCSRVRLRARRGRDRLGQPAACAATGERSYRDVARRAGVWLRRVATAGSAWNELPGDLGLRFTSGSTAARPGSAGCSWISPTRGHRSGRESGAAWSALAALNAGAVHDRVGALWYENRTGAQAGGCPPSRRGTGAPPGIAGFAARLAGWSGRSPGGQRSGELAGAADRSASAVSQRSRARRSSDSSRSARRRAPRMIVGVVLGPLLWLVALVAVAWLLRLQLGDRARPADRPPRRSSSRAGRPRRAATWARPRRRGGMRTRG